MLIGCKLGFLDLDYYEDVIGYISFEESDYDLFEVGYIFIFIVLVVGEVEVCDL